MESDNYAILGFALEKEEIEIRLRAGKIERLVVQVLENIINQTIPSSDQ